MAFASDISRGRRVRRAHALIGAWEARQFVLENYLSRQRIYVDPILLQILNDFAGFQKRNEAITLLNEIPGAESLIGKLISHDVLLEEGSELELCDRRVAEHWRWGHEARFFHFGTKNIPFEEDAAVQRASLLRLMREEPPLGPFKELDADKLSIPGDLSGLNDELGKTLLRRRTRRNFSRQPVTLEAFGKVLRWTWGKTHHMESGEIGPYILKTSPSGGARHSIEVYPLVRRVDGLKPGIYHYSVLDHALEPIRDDLGDEDLASFFVGQHWLRNAAAVFVMASRIRRSDWKYRHSHAYRVLLLDAGHLGQTFHLVCTSLGLAPFTLAGFKDSRLEEALGIDGIREIVLYAAALGYPENSDNGAAGQT